MKLKKLVSMFLIGAMVATMLVGCGNGDNNSSKGEGSKENKKVIKIGLEAAYPPFEYLEDDGKTITGFDYDLATAICDELGYEAEFVNVAWDGIFAGLDKADYDLIFSAITVTPERAEKYSFSKTYINNFQCIATVKDAKVKPKKLEDLEGLKVGYQEESTSDIFLTDNIEAGKLKCKTNEYSKITDAFSDLKNGRLEAIVCDSTVAGQYTVDGTYEVTWKQEEEPEEIAVCFPKDSELVKEFDKVLEKFEKDGTLDKLLEDYFGDAYK